MGALTIDIPEPIQKWLESRLEGSEYKTPEEYVLSLLREERKRSAEERLEELLLEGLESGPPIEYTEESWRKKKDALAERLRAPAGHK
ncbi:MAG: hypothetical protein GHCLOJNM_04151 [bacterium]|nr:hypothetical protein [bacterium]